MVPRARILIQHVIQTMAALVGFSIQRAVSGREVAEVLYLFKPTVVPEDLRLVGSGDGSYAIPTSAMSIDALFSPGVSSEVSFDLEFAKRGARCFLIDGNVEANNDYLQEPNFHFNKLWLSDRNSQNEVTLESWVQQWFHKSSRLGLQMDIEGSEYRVLRATAKETLSKFVFIAIEFHDLRAMTTRAGLERVKAALNQLLETHEVCWTNVNSIYPPLRRGGVLIPEVLEVTLLRRDASEEARRSSPESDEKRELQRGSWQIDWPSLRG